MIGTNSNGFVPNTDTIALDIKSMMNGFDYSASRTCMPDQDVNCSTILSQLGLSIADGSTTGTQAAFRI